jgi:hypothetical protein
MAKRSKAGGVFPNYEGQGVMIHFCNEMSMLAYYRDKYPERFPLFPILPNATYVMNRYVGDLTNFTALGKYSAGPVLDGIFDPSSWGQALGGTPKGHGNNIGFHDAAHVVGQANGLTGCRVRLRCSTANTTAYCSPRSDATAVIQSLIPISTSSSPSSSSSSDQSSAAPTSTSTTGTEDKKKCFTQPFVWCSSERRDKFEPLWNLHVHSKNTHLFVSTECDCQSDGFVSIHYPGHVALGIYSAWALDPRDAFINTFKSREKTGNT